MLHRLRLRSTAAGLVGALLLATSACQFDTVDLPERDDDTHKLTHMGSLGNSLTAGFQNGGIEETGQVASFANLVSQRVAGRAMQMPLVNAPGIGSELGMSPLFVTASGSITREPLTLPPDQLAKNLTYPLPYDNLAVPGATTRQILDTRFGDEVGNALFDLILRNVALPGGGTCVGQMERIRPDIITAWSGNNEILGGALSGEPQSVDPGAPGYVVPLEDFQLAFEEMLDRIAALNPKMVAIANVPPITAIPYTRFFGTGSLPGINRWNMDEDNDGDGDDVKLVLLTAPISDCVACYLPGCGGATTPCRSIPPQGTLTFVEADLVDSTIEAYNDYIASAVLSRGWALVDIHGAFLEIQANPSAELNVRFPLIVNPLTGEARQNEESAFTLDGVHPSERGHARVANDVLKAFNDTYGTNYAPYDVSAVQNIAGFEKFVAPAKVGAGVFTPEGRAGLKSVVEMLSAHPSR